MYARNFGALHEVSLVLVSAGVMSYARVYFLAYLTKVAHFEFNLG